MEKSKRTSGDRLKKVDDDVYKGVVLHELEEATSRDTKSDTDMYISTCADIRKCLHEILTLKCSGTEEKEEVSELSTEACILTSVLKKLNRLEKVRLSLARDAICIEKQKVESRYMQYQNLLYEADHYNSEYRKCMQFKSKDEDIDLITNEDFFRNAPEDVTSQFLVDEDKNHEMYLARLEYELNQRINLAELLEEYKIEKKQIKDDIIQIKSKLAVMEPKLLAVITAANALQDHLGLCNQETSWEHKLALYLPDPLYLMYCNTESFRQFRSEKHFTIDIKGGLEDIRRFEEARKALNGESDHEQDALEETTGGSKKHRRRKGGDVERGEEKKKHITQKHPLSVVVTMKAEQVTLKMHFNYLPQLRIVTVTSNSDGHSEMTQRSTCSHDVLTGESILNQLYARDTGRESPNSVNYLQLKQVGIKRFQSIIPQVGYAYNWAQKICGIEFLYVPNFEDRSKKQDKVLLHTVEETFTIIERRLRARCALAVQLHHLELKTIVAVPQHVQLPSTTASNLTKYHLVSFQRFTQNTMNARQLVDRGLVTADDIFHLAIISRQKVTLYAWIVIKNQYPDVVPMFVLHIKHNCDLHSGNSDEVRDLERNINSASRWKALAQGGSIAGWLLAAQMKYLCALFDVYLETEPRAASPRSTMFFRKVSGRNRRRPYVFHKVGNGIFAQY